MKQMIALWSMVKVHGLMVAGSGLKPPFTPSTRPQDQRGAGAFGNGKSNVVPAQAGYPDRTVTEAPETQIYFTTHGSGAFPWLRLRTVVRGDRASRSIVNRTTALWSIWVVASLILAALGSVPFTPSKHGRGFVISRGSNGISKIAQWSLMRVRWTLPLTNGRKRT